MLHVCRLLNREWATGCMEEEGCCCCCCRGGGGEAGSHRENTLIQLLRKKETRLRRISRFLAATLLLLLSGTLALLVLVLHGGRDHPLPDNQPMPKPDGLPPGVRSEFQQQKDLRHPRAMLTGPRDINGKGKYLQWESVHGNANCQGGVSYSNGNLVVPRRGYYSIFLQITYEKKENFSCDDELRLTNKVFLFQDNYQKDVALLSSMDSVSCSMKQWSKSLYTSGIFLLQANSTLHVKSSHAELIANHEDQVFFGAELLPQ